jgi:hypothetical protein
MSDERPNDACPSCGTRVRPTGATVIGSGFPMRDFDTETAVCPACGLPLRRAHDERWAWAGDWPPWVLDAARREKWDARAHQQWERLRERVDELGVEVEPTDAEITGIAAYGRLPSFIAERVDSADDRPVLEALHRLVNAVARAQREGR